MESQREAKSQTQHGTKVTVRGRWEESVKLPGGIQVGGAWRGRKQRTRAPVNVPR